MTRAERVLLTIGYSWCVVAPFITWLALRG